MLYQIWAAIYISMSFIQDQSHRSAKGGCGCSRHTLPQGPGSLGHEEPSRKEPSELHDLLPQRLLYFRNSGSRVTVGTVRKTPQKSHQSLAQPHREAAQNTLCVPGRNCNALRAWASGSGKTPGKFLIPTLQKEVMVSFQNRNHSCNGVGVWEEEQIRKIFCLTLHNLQCLAEI